MPRTSTAILRSSSSSSSSNIRFTLANLSRGVDRGTFDCLLIAFTTFLPAALLYTIFKDCLQRQLFCELLTSLSKMKSSSKEQLNGVKWQGDMNDSHREKRKRLAGNIDTAN
uniref:Uncharacterized protein n=1 Tax=Glossina pallidipes TaxID=7398 RepID=A0A1A9ZQ26_GLOPL